MRLFEVTPEKELVWEFIAPFDFKSDQIYRAYRYPYEYVPQVQKPEEIPVERIDNKKFRMPGAGSGEITDVVEVAGTWGYAGRADACVTEDNAPF